MEHATASDRPLRVLIVDCHAAFRGAARALLLTEGLEVIGDFEPGRAAEHAAMTLRPDVVLIDVCTDGLESLEFARRVASLPDAPAIVLMSAAPADTLLSAACGAGAFFAKAEVTARALAGVAGRQDTPHHVSEQPQVA